MVEEKTMSSNKPSSNHDKNGHKRKHHSHHRDKNGDSRPVSSSSTINHEARDPNLRSRIRKYLEHNKDKQYIDIDDMVHTLHTRYPDYNRKKLKVFRRIVEIGFDNYYQPKQGNSPLEVSSSSDESEKSKRRHRKDDSSNDKRANGENKRSENSANSNNSQARTDETPKSPQVADKVQSEHPSSTTRPAVTPGNNSVVPDQVDKSPESSIVTPQASVEPFQATKIKDPKSSEPPPETPEVLDPSSKIIVPNLSKSSASTTSDLQKRDNLNDTVTVTDANINSAKVQKTNEMVLNFTPAKASGATHNEANLKPYSSSIGSPRPRVLPERSTTPVPKEKRPANSLSNGGSATLVDLTEEEAPSNKSSRKPSRASSPVPASAKKPLTNGIVRKKALPEFEVQESSSNFSMLGGVEKVLVQICKLMIHLKHPEVFRHIGISPTRGILLHGPPGCGKTLIANAVAGQLKLPILKLAATEIVSGISGESESRLRGLFDQAMSSAPCILFIDEIDAITQRRDQSNKGMESRIVGQLLACMDDLNSKMNEKEGQVIVIGATNRPDVLDPALRRAGRFESEIAIGIPDENSRKQILIVLSKDLNISKDFDMGQLARMTPGYVGADLASLLREAAINAVNRILHELQPVQGSSGVLKLDDLLTWFGDDTPVSESTLSNIQIDLSDFEKALKVVQPSAMREGFATVPNVTWNDIGALDDIREELEVSILAPVNHPELTEALGLGAPTGILLCGPPGCGKTLLAKAVANQAGINFISVKGPELLNMYVGESERAVRQVFQRAKNSAPCVIFFDELDSLAPRRSGSGDSSGASRVVNQLLTEMDGVEGRKGVYIMAATNRVDIIDPAVLRPGRLQKILHVGLPTASDRISILKALTKHRPLLGPDVNFTTLAENPHCDGFSGADLSALVTEASVSAFKEHISIQNKDQDSVEIRVHFRHFESAFTRVRPSVIGKDKLHYEAMKRKHVAGADESPLEKIPKLDNIDGATGVESMGDIIDKVSSPMAIATEPEEVAIPEIRSEPETPRVMRFLEKMEVRVKDSCRNRKIAGCQGFVTCIIPPDAYFVQIKSSNISEEIQVSITDLEPFTPEPEDFAKILYSGESEEIVKVLNYCATDDVATEDESVTVLFDNGDLKIFSLDQLCKVVV